MKIEIEYDGAYPNLCSGVLIVKIGNDYGPFIDTYTFESHSLRSGGSVTFDENWSEHITSGPWSVYKWPADFPEEYKEIVTDEINAQISHGCCGGCV